jgi:hypothetical protein
MDSQSEYRQRESEYVVDRLRADIVRLEKDIADLNEGQSEVLAAEVALAVVCFVVGFFFGAVYA